MASSLSLSVALTVSIRRRANDCDASQKKVAATADKFETKGAKPIGVATLRFLAESNIAQAKARKKKKSKSPK